MRRVRYEDFLADPVRTARQLAALTGLDEAWRSALPARQRRLVTAICAPLLTA